MQQLSHHTLSSVPAFSTFAFTVCPGFICFNRLLLKWFPELLLFSTVRECEF